MYRFFALLFVLLPYIAMSDGIVSPAVTCSACVADFALYDPGYEEDGVWEEEVIALKAMFDMYGWSYQTVSSIDINRGLLGSGANRKYRALIAPGGYAYYRKVAVSSAGDNFIRQKPPFKTQPRRHRDHGESYNE